MRCIDIVFDNLHDYGHAAILRHCSMPLQHKSYYKLNKIKPRHVVTQLRQFTPHLPNKSLRKTLHLVSKFKGKELVEALRNEADATLSGNASWKLDEAAVLLVVSDLASLGWRFKVVENTIYMIVSPPKNGAHEEAKSTVRRALCDTRNQQLSENGTKAFLAYMHRPRVFGDRTIDIGNLVDNGTDLANALRKYREKNLKKVVDPYIQFVDDGVCEHTGYKLIDIWRYFRHTWSLEYRATPGRSLSFLIRNRARRDHPVIGIVSLANAVMQLRDRDDAIGWTAEGIVARILKRPGFWREFHGAALQYLRHAREAIRSDDLMGEIGECDSIGETVKRLQALSVIENERRKSQLEEIHQEALNSNSATAPTRIVRKKEDGSIDWVALSETSLYRRKRAATLSDILFAENILINAPTDDNEVISMLSKEVAGNLYNPAKSNADFDRAFRIAIREIKKAGVATRIMDVNVCGASPVYREILGGKLAALSLFSEEIQKAYSSKYNNAASEIASGMAARPIVKPTRISLLTTTSLYGVGSSQYNRVSMSYDGRKVEWKKIGTTEGYGTVHFSKKTIETLRNLGIARSKRRNVNNQFGEGTSPLMRQMREGLDFLGFNSDEVLQHSQCRIVYLLNLYPGACDDLLLNRDSHPKAPSMAKVAKMWSDRWLSMRVQNNEILERLSCYSPESVRMGLTPDEI